jgi:exodeoxyribonuclease VII large subunit
MQDIQTVSELTHAIKKQLETRFTLLSVRGEISNFKQQASGHLYFTLKDATAQISAVLFKGNTGGLTRLPKDGDQVTVRGELSVYAPRGNYQILVRELNFIGVGELLLKLHELKTTLEARGWFDKKNKKTLPKFPRTIGVVTSPTGSVIQDILNILTRRFHGFHLILNPVKVQGEGAAQEIAAAIEQFNRYGLADVLIVGRGGGSLEDLWAFNEEVVAAAIHASKIPIISAVGHETDTCIADLVADLRAPTPSAAAEMATIEKAQHLHFFSQIEQRLRGRLETRIREHRLQLKGILRHPLLHTSAALLGKHHQQLDEIAAALERSLQEKLTGYRLRLAALHKGSQALRPTAQISSLRERLLQWEKSLSVAMRKQVELRRGRLTQLTSHMRAIDPKNLLTKGYCILFHEKNDSVILNSQSIALSDSLRIQLSDGIVKATVTEIKS